MKFNRFLLTVLCFVLIENINAQADSLKSTSQIDTILYNKKNEKFYFGGKKMQVADLRPMLNKFNSSAFEFKQYQKRAAPGIIILLTGITSGVIALTRLNKDKQFFTPYSITLFAGDLIGIPLMISAKKHLLKSASLYNKEIREF